MWARTWEYYDIIVSYFTTINNYSAGGKTSYMCYCIRRLCFRREKWISVLTKNIWRSKYSFDVNNKRSHSFVVVEKCIIILLMDKYNKCVKKNPYAIICEKQNLFVFGKLHNFINHSFRGMVVNIILQGSV
jgi:hypothetical protein